MNRLVLLCEEWRCFLRQLFMDVSDYLLAFLTWGWRLQIRRWRGTRLYVVTSKKTALHTNKEASNTIFCVIKDPFTATCFGPYAAVLRCTRLYVQKNVAYRLYALYISKLRYPFYRLLVMLMCFVLNNFITGYARIFACRSQWLRGLGRGSAAAYLLGLRVRIMSGAWMSVSCKCCVLLGRGLCVELITRPEESYRVCLCDWSWSLDNEDALVH
jgi:hypothetical protein